MFTGIIECLGKVVEIKRDKNNIHFFIDAPFTHELKVDQSIAHNGVCLTVTEIKNSIYCVTAIQETLNKTNLGNVKVGDVINLERCMLMNGRLDGHIVQGHVDQVGTCLSVKDEKGSWRYEFEYDTALGNITVEKGSIAVNGVSLTCFNSRSNNFIVAIIPYTYEHTNFHQLKAGGSVNLEFDVVGKYVERLVRGKR